MLFNELGAAGTALNSQLRHAIHNLAPLGKGWQLWGQTRRCKATTRCSQHRTSRKLCQGHGLNSTNLPQRSRTPGCIRSSSSNSTAGTLPEQQPNLISFKRHHKIDWLSVSAKVAFLVLLCCSAGLQFLGRQVVLPGVTCLGVASIFFSDPFKNAAWRLRSSATLEGPAQDGEGPSSSSGEPTKDAEKDDSPDKISIESADEGEPAPPALTELGNVETPASVWLPYKDTNTHRNRLRAHIGPAMVTIGGRLGRSLIQILRLPGHLIALTSFKAQQIMLASTGTKLVAVFIAGIPMCLVGGIIYSWTSGKSFMDGIINAYGALYKIPGVMVIGEINSATAHVMNILWLVGTFTFAIVLGVVTEDIVNTVISIRSGNYPVVASNHTLILNWNTQTISLLRQIAINKLERANGAYNGPVVILANRDKEEMDEELRSALRGFELEWHTRVGSPHSINDLQRVAAGQARTVILLNPEGEEDVGKKQVAAILGVQSARANTKPRPFLRLAPQNIAIQVPEDAEDKDLISAARDIMAASAQKFKLTYLSCKRDMSTLLALSAIQPGVASVYCTIVQQTQRGVEFYLKRFPELTGKTFAEARRSFDDAVLCGYMRPGENGTTEMHVNCEDSDILQEADRIIALSQTGRFKVAKRSKKDEEKRATGEDVVQMHANALQNNEDPNLTLPKHIVVLWFEEPISDLLLSLSAFAPRRSTVSIISKEKPKDFPEEGKMEGIKFEFIEGDPAKIDRLEKGGVPRADAIIIAGSLDEKPAEEADARTIALVMLVQECLAMTGRNTGQPAHIVGMVRKPESVEVANYLMERLGKGGATAELIHPDELVSGIISQVAAEPDMASLFSSFVYSSEGSEIYLRRPWRYQFPEDQEISFAQVSEACRLRNEIAIGYISEAGNVRMAPRATSTRKFSSNDRILTIAEG